jgi:peptidoglycan/xylan/chitin deacetylase (PgdA/CDA1 family)
MAAGRIEFGSHTNLHRHLPGLPDEELRQELLDSRRRIAERLGSCDCLAYPFGEWDERVADAARAAGYRSRRHRRGTGSATRTPFRSPGSPSTTATTSAASRSS